MRNATVHGAITPRNKRHHPFFIGRREEQHWVNDWLLDPHAPTRFWAIQSISGGGKTSLAREILRISEENSAHVLLLDCKLIDSPELCFREVDRWLGGPSQSEVGVEAVLAMFQDGSQQQKLVVCFDGIDQSETVESFLREVLCPSLPSERILVIMTTGTPLPMRWRSHPVLLHMLKHTDLRSFTPHETADFCRQAGIEDDAVALSLFSSTAGHPLAVALAVESYLHTPSRQSLNLISSEISGTLLRDVSSPELHQLLDVLTITRYADQDLMSRILKRSVGYAEFQALAKLSIVHYTNHGLAINGTARVHLMDDLRIRDRLYYYTLHRAAVSALTDKIRETRGGLRTTLSAQLVSMCIDVSDVLVFPWPDMEVHPSRDYPACTYLQPGDAPSIHRLLDRNPGGCVECWDPVELHQFVDMLVDRFPSRTRAIRNTNGEIAAFYVVLPLYAGTAELLPKNIQYLLEVSLDKRDYLNLKDRKLEEVDTYLMVLGSVDSQNPEFTIADLQVGMALDQWNVVEYGSRQLHIGRLEQSTFFYNRLGFTYLKPHEPRDPGRRMPLLGMKLHSLDLRAESSNNIARWVTHLLSQVYPFPMASRIDALVDTKELRQLLSQLDDSQVLATSSLAQQLGLTGVELQQRIHTLMTCSEPPKPLTNLHQEVLSASYVHTPRHYMDAMERLHVTRTTYYRQLNDAVQALAKVLS